MQFYLNLKTSRFRGTFVSIVRKRLARTPQIDLQKLPSELYNLAILVLNVQLSFDTEANRLNASCDDNYTQG